MDAVHVAPAWVYPMLVEKDECTMGKPAPYREEFDCEEQADALRFRGWSEKALHMLRDVLHDQPRELMRHSVNGHFYSEKRSNPLAESGLLGQVPPELLEPIKKFLCTAWRKDVKRPAFDALRHRVKRALDRREWRDRKQEVGSA